MREILFRAKRKNWRELPKEEWWVEGYYVKCRKYDYILPIFNEYEPFHGYDDRYDEWVEIAPETLCQYTELKDKKGNRIWENDIVRIENSVDEGVGNIEFYEGIWFVDGKPNNCLYDISGYDYDAEIEVIGNIFDNPELLKGE